MKTHPLEQQHSCEAVKHAGTAHGCSSECPPRAAGLRLGQRRALLGAAARLGQGTTRGTTGGTEGLVAFASSGESGGGAPGVPVHEPHPQYLPGSARYCCCKCGLLLQAAEAAGFILPNSPCSRDLNTCLTKPEI